LPHTFLPFTLFAAYAFLSHLWRMCTLFARTSRSSTCRRCSFPTWTGSRTCRRRCSSASRWDTWAQCYELVWGVMNWQKFFKGQVNAFILFQGT
jgi:hypothetical protein